MSMISLAGLGWRESKIPGFWAGKKTPGATSNPSWEQPEGIFKKKKKSRMDLNPIFLAPLERWGDGKKSWKKVIFFFLGRGSVEFLWFVSLVRNKNHLDTLVVIPACSGDFPELSVGSGSGWGIFIPFSPIYFILPSRNSPPVHKILLLQHKKGKTSLFLPISPSLNCL